MIAFNQILWNQYGASIDMLKNAIVRYPEDHWDNNKKFFYIAYHTLVFLDYYLTFPAQPISSPLPFTIATSEDEIGKAVDDLLPNRMYSKSELLDYLQTSREKCRHVIESLTEEKLQEHWVEVAESGGKDYSILELLLYNMRHVQHHAAQLNLLLRQQIDDAPAWLRRAKDIY